MCRTAAFISNNLVVACIALHSISFLGIAYRLSPSPAVDPSIPQPPTAAFPFLVLRSSHDDGDDGPFDCDPLSFIIDPHLTLFLAKFNSSLNLFLSYLRTHSFTRTLSSVLSLSTLTFGREREKAKKVRSQQQLLRTAPNFVFASAVQLVVSFFFGCTVSATSLLHISRPVQKKSSDVKGKEVCIKGGKDEGSNLCNVCIYTSLLQYYHYYYCHISTEYFSDH
jgi:hypothetical protein